MRIECRQEATQTQTPTGSASKTISPPPPPHTHTLRLAGIFKRYIALHANCDNFLTFCTNLPFCVNKTPSCLNSFTISTTQPSNVNIFFFLFFFFYLAFPPKTIIFVWLLLIFKCHCLQYLSPVKRICVFEHSVMTNFNCACPAIQRGQGSGFLSEGSAWLTVYMSEQRRFWRDCADAQARLNLRCSHKR